MNQQLTNVVTFVVLGFVGFRLIDGLRHSRSSQGRALARQIFRNIGWRHVWPVPLVLSTVVAVATALIALPGLSWGWWSALGGEGNPVFASTDATVGTLWEWLIPLFFMGLLIPALPLFAFAEERVFRAGAERWTNGRRALKVVEFGMVHALIGIPIGAALALSIGGGYFMWIYLKRFASVGDQREALVESATAHTVYNELIVVLLIVAFALDAIL
ncbi:MAG: hypothetical protein HY826_11635 [Actinobacteria bacterium]|nr:hypothetical protein [Actinomycetota bacterium]